VPRCDRLAAASAFSIDRWAFFQRFCVGGCVFGSICLDVDACIGKVGRVEQRAGIVLDTGSDLRRDSFHDKGSSPTFKGSTPRPTDTGFPVWWQPAVQQNGFTDQKVIITSQQGSLARCSSQCQLTTCYGIQRHRVDDSQQAISCSLVVFLPVLSL
jgi:hypothetical protein